MTNALKANKTLTKFCFERKPTIPLAGVKFVSVKTAPEPIEENLAKNVVFSFVDEATKHSFCFSVSAKTIRRLMSKRFKGTLRFGLQRVELENGKVITK